MQLSPEAIWLATAVDMRIGIDGAVIRQCSWIDRQSAKLTASVFACAYLSAQLNYKKYLKKIQK